MKIHAIQTGVVRVKQAFAEGSSEIGIVRTILRMLPQPPEVEIPIYAWAIEHPEGVIVVDTGDNAQTGKIPAGEVIMQPGDELGSQLQQLGIQPRDVKKVVLTHLHVDHIGGLEHVRHAPIFAGDADAHAVNTPSIRWRVKLVNPIPAWLQLTPVGMTDTPFGAFSRSVKITQAGDVIAVPTPGHTAGHISVIVVDGDTHIMLAGDITCSEAALLQRKLEGISFDLVNHLPTVETVLRHASLHPLVYLPAHDAESGERLARRRTVTV